MRLIPAVLCCVPLLAGEPGPSATEIMERVGLNQERAQRMRAAFVHDQTVLVRLHRANRKLAREERYRYTVTPTPDGVKKERIEFAGRYAAKDGKLVEYGRPGYQYKELDIDGELAEDFADEFTNGNSRDGISRDLFPLTPADQNHYRFRLEGRQQYQNRDVFRITFKPASRSGKSWAGEALIDAAEYQPVLVTTWLARGVPAAVRIFLGTNVKHIGFKVAYDRFEEGIWFPVSYGGEFELKAVFFYKRIISVSMRNSGFRRSEVASRIEYDLP